MNTTLGSRSMTNSGSVSLSLLPRDIPVSMAFNKIRFTETVRIVSYQRLLFQHCETSGNSDFRLVSRGPLSFVNWNHKSGSILAEDDTLEVENSQFNFNHNEGITVQRSKSADFRNSYFSSKAAQPAVSLFEVKSAVFRSCNFSHIKKGGCICTSGADSVKIEVTTFANARGSRGGAVEFDGSCLKIEAVDTFNCSADKEGGAFFFHSGDVFLDKVGFSRNTAPEGASISSKVVFLMNDCHFEGSAKDEIKGEYIADHARYSLKRVPLMARPPTPSQSPTASRSPERTRQPVATDVVFSESEYFTPILICAITLVLIIIIMAVAAIVYTKLSRSENTIYAGEADTKDENEMGTVEIKSRYVLSDMYGSDL